MYILFAYLK